jgi:hypothetical protein
MVQAYQGPKLEYAGSAEAQNLARLVFSLMRSQGLTMGVRTPIRQTLQNLVQYLAEQKYNGLEELEALATLVDAALSANPAIFLREEEEEGQVTFKTTKLGVAPPAIPVPLDHHSFHTRLFEGARPVVPMTEEEIAAKAAETASRQEGAVVSLPLPFAASEAKATPAPAPVVEAPKVQPKPVETAKPVVKPEVEAAMPAPVVAKPVEAPKAPVVEPAVAVPAPVVEAAKPVEAPKPAPVAPAPRVEAPKAAPTIPVNLEVADGVTLDLNLSANEILDKYGDYFASALLKVLPEDFRFINFAEDWYLEDSIDRLSKGDFRRIRDYMNEVSGPVSDSAIMSDVYNRRTSDHDYEAKRFELNFRLAKEKKDFEFVGANDERVWTAPGLPAIGQGKRKASEIGLDYKFLEDEHLNDPSNISVVKGKKRWQHTISFYEYENGLLPFDLSAKEMFPSIMNEEQKALVLRLEAPQLYYTYTAELRYPTGARGGWIAGLEDFFANNLIPGAKLLMTQGDRSNHFLIEYEADEEQERRLLFYDERRQKFVYRTIAFACKVDEQQILTPERFGKLDNQKRLEENDRKKTDFLVASAFELVGTKAGDTLKATLEDLYPLVNIERPFSRNYLRSLLTAGNNAFRPDGTEEDAYTYKIGAVKR